MTKEDIEKIVEKTVEWLNGYAFTDDDKSAHIPTLIHDFLKDSRVYFDVLVQPSLPSDLDEAAQKVEDYYDVGEEHGYLCCHRGDIKDAFKAGAKWTANQGVGITDFLGVEVTVEGTITDEIAYNGLSVMLDKESVFKPGDKVIVKIRKKEE